MEEEKDARGKKKSVQSRHMHTHAVLYLVFLLDAFETGSRDLSGWFQVPRGMSYGFRYYCDIY